MNKQSHWTKLPEGDDALVYRRGRRYLEQRINIDHRLLPLSIEPLRRIWLNSVKPMLSINRLKRYQRLPHALKLERFKKKLNCQL